MTTKELMIGDIIGVTHEELGLVYAEVEYINEVGDLCVRADNPYMDGGLELDLFDDYLKGVEPLEITEKFLLKNGFAKGKDVSGIHDVYVHRSDKDEFGMSQNIVRVNLLEELGVLVRTERTCKDPKIGMHVMSAHRPNSSFVHQLQQVCRLCGIEIEWKL